MTQSRFYAIVLFVSVFVLPSSRILSQEGASSNIAKSFRCPETYTSDGERNNAYRSFVSRYSEANPDSNVRDLMIFRYRLLVTHSCTQTLKQMLANVSPTTELLRFQDEEYGPETREYDKSTKVWTAFFRHNGEPTRSSDADLIFNFYGWTPARSAESVAQAFVRDRGGIQILGSFQAPDGSTGQPAFFVVSEAIYPDEKDSYLNMSKIASLGATSYTVTFARKFEGSSATDAAQKGKLWFLSAEGKQTFLELGKIGLGPGWKEALSTEASSTPRSK